MRYFYAYSLPGSSTTICGGADEIYEGIMENSFHISPFDSCISKPFSIPNHKTFEFEHLDMLVENAEYSLSPYKFPESPTNREQHTKEIAEIKSFINGNPRHKVIAAKAIIGNDRIAIRESFMNLREKRPDAFVFLFHSPQTGTWLGASPELLLSLNGNEFRTVALAGTRPAGSSGEWTKKNKEEQNIVENYILDIFRRNRLKTSVSAPRTRNAGNIEHLVTEFMACSDSGTPLEEISDLLRDLSPTPALCGYPKAQAMEVIKRAEDFQRAYYGGFCGPVENNGNFVLYVILRSIWIVPQGWCMYAGGGITYLSDCVEEWDEAEKKAESVIGLLKTKPQ